MAFPLLSAKLIELRTQHNYSQQEIADFLGLTREAYSHYERNAREPNLEVLVKLSNLYQIDISELINENTILNLPLQSVGTILDTSEITPLGYAIATTFFKGVLPPVPPKEFLSTTQNSNPTLTISKNLNHFLKILSGKNSSVDLTNITKEDIALLAQYKKLDKENQKEVHEFIKFKRALQKKKKE